MPLTRVQSCDGDCACASTLPRTPHPATAVPANLRQSPRAALFPFAADSWLLTAPDAAGWALINETARQVFESFVDLHPSGEKPANISLTEHDFRKATDIFYRAGFLTAASPDVSSLGFPSHSPALEAWLFLTRSCNLACAHCFVDKNSQQMDRATGIQAVNKLFEIAQQHAYPSVKIKYAGGEPTLRWDLVTSLHLHARQSAQTAGIPLTEILVTNGVALSRSRLEYLQAGDIHLALSLDGFGPGHDRQRPSSANQQTFERVFHTLETALELGLRPYLTVTLTSLNLDDLPALTEFAIQNRLFLNWNFYRPRQPHDPLMAAPDALTDVLHKSLQVIEKNLPDYPFLDKLVDRSNFSVAHEYTCGAGRNYLSIDCDGSISPCHTLSATAHRSVPLATLSHPHFENFINPAVDEKENCRTCEWRYWCAGGCPVLAGAIHENQSPTPLYCHVYKATYPGLLRLKGLQILNASQVLF